MNYRGSAILGALWLLTLLAAIGHWGMRGLEDDIRAATNRINLTKAAWARDACLEILRDDVSRRWVEFASSERSRGGSGELTVPELRRLERDNTLLGDGVSCSTSLADVNSGLDVNVIDSAVVVCLVGHDHLVRRWLDNRPYMSVATLVTALELDMESADIHELQQAVSVYGTGRLNINAASARAIECGLGVSEESARAFVAMREQQGGFSTIDAAIGAIPLGDRPDIRSIRISLTTTLVRFLVRVTGTAGLPVVRSQTTVQGMAIGGRLQLLQRESE